ncbi:MAG: hypothetical protein ACFFB3_17185 [Candidatus Hodarchaeota archaeon]
MKLPKAAKDAFALDMAAKFMATHDANHEPNIAMISTVSPWNDEHLIFGDFLMWKTKKNLENGSPISVSVITEDLKSCFEVRGQYIGYEIAGDKFEAMSKKDLFRYSAIGLLRGVGTISVDEVYPLSVNALGVAKEWLLAKICGVRHQRFPEGKEMHPNVERIANVLKGAKFLTVARDDHMEQFPVLGMRSLGDYLVIRSDLPLKIGDIIAASVLSMDLTAFQIKGEFIGIRRSRGIKHGYIRVTNVKTQTPPLVSREVPSYNSRDSF